MYNYKCIKCGSIYNLQSQPDYSNCIIKQPITDKKCNVYTR